MRRTVIAVHFIVAMRLIALHRRAMDRIWNIACVSLKTPKSRVRYAFNYALVRNNPVVDATPLVGAQIYEEIYWIEKKS
jgi:hypothetical protein